MWRQRLKYHAKKYRSEFRRLAWSLLAGVISTLLASGYGRHAFSISLVDSLNIGMLAAILVLVTWQSFSIKRNLTWKIGRLEGIITELYGSPDERAEYTQRLSHFIEEKALLADNLVKKQLPRLLARVVAENRRDAKQVFIILDSGTTLGQSFPKLKIQGFSGLPPAIAEESAIYTNSLAGVDAFNKERKFEEYPLNELKIHLLGGNPLEKYRATTGEETLAALDRLNELKKGDKPAAIVGILTANWILTGKSFERLVICAKGRGHFEFKKRVFEISDLIVVVAPLGKLLRLNSDTELNEMLAGEGGDYKGFSLEGLKGPKADSIYLLTSTRKRTDSFLFKHSLHLRGFQPDPQSRKYILLEQPGFDPPGTPQHQMEVEMPHSYLRPFSDNLFFL